MPVSGAVYEASENAWLCPPHNARTAVIVAVPAAPSKVCRYVAFAAVAHEALADVVARAGPPVPSTTNAAAARNGRNRRTVKPPTSDRLGAVSPLTTRAAER